MREFWNARPGSKVASGEYEIPGWRSRATSSNDITVRDVNGLVSFTAAGTYAIPTLAYFSDGAFFFLSNDSGGIVVLDADSSETISGQSICVLQDKTSILIARASSTDWRILSDASQVNIFTPSRELLSGSSNGRGLKVVATATAGTQIHATSGIAAHRDKIWLYAVNSDTTARKLTIEFGGVTSPDDTIEQTIPAEVGPVCVVPGLLLKDSGTPINVKAFCATANVVSIFGFIDRYTTGAYPSLEVLTGSTNGRGIKVVATATAGTQIHATSGIATTTDEIWLYAVNSDTTARKLTIEFGGVTSPDDTIEQTIPPESGLFCVVPGLLLKDSGTPINVKAFCATANVVSIFGLVERRPGA